MAMFIKPSATTFAQLEGGKKWIVDLLTDFQYLKNALRFTKQKQICSAFLRLPTQPTFYIRADKKKTKVLQKLLQKFS